jgi:hypothetical protein
MDLGDEMMWTVGLAQDMDWWTAFVNMIMNLCPLTSNPTKHSLSLSLLINKANWNYCNSGTQ